MDVRCERCRTEYEFDETYLTDVGVAVKCTTCGHVFKVRKTVAPEPAPLRPREWKLRRRSGEVISCKDLGELQRWIVERRVSRDDEVSLSGDAWRALGGMPELASFFQVVEAAEQAQLQVQQQAARATGSAPTRVSPSAGWDAGPPPPRRQRDEPAWASDDAQGSDDDLDQALKRAVKPSRAPLVIGLLAFLGAAGGGAYWFMQQRPPPAKPAARPPVAVAIPLPPAAPVAAPVAAPGAVPAPAAGAPAAPTPPPAAVAQAVPPHPAAPAPVPAPAPVVPAVEAKAPPVPTPTRAVEETAKPEAAKPAKPAHHDFNWYLTHGHKLLDSRPKEALALFEQATELDPSSPEPDSGRGLAYTNLEQWDPAISAFQAAIKKSPEFTEAVMGLAEAYRYKGVKDKAIRYYQRYLDLTPDGPDAPVAKAQLESLKGQ
ncbi:MAG: zinc-ribbon domain-containing protein [Deltaproteobacteria bacterium]